MSWLADIAGKAESFLNQIDQNAAVALSTSKNDKDFSRPPKSEPFIERHDVTDQWSGGASVEKSPAATISGPSLVESKKLGSSNNSRRGNKKQTVVNKTTTSNSTSAVDNLVTSSSSSVKVPESVSGKGSNSVIQNGTADKTKGASSGISRASENVVSNANEDELIAYLNSNTAKGEVNMSSILKDEVASQARELKLMTENNRRLQKEHEKLKQQLETCQEKLANEESVRHSSEVEEQDLRKILDDKDSEISSLNTRYQQALEALQKLELTQDSVQKLEQCLLENSQLKSENENLLKRTEILASQVETADSHVLSLKSSMTSMEKEFANYKEKAKSILNYKDELIAAVKSEGGTIQSNDNNLNTAEELLAEVTALKNERELLQADLSQTRATVESLKEDSIRQEKEISTLRCFTDDLNSQLSREKESLSSLQTENLQLGQQLTSLQFKLEREKNEKKRFEDQVTKHKESRQGQSFGMDNINSNGYVSEGYDKELTKLKTRVSALSQSLYEKQSLINDISTDKQLLQIEVERLKSELRDCRVENNDLSHGGVLPQTVIASQPLYLSESPWDSRVSARMKRIYTQLDAVFCQFGLALRKRPNLRLGMSVYVVILHLWVFFVLFTWMHHAAPE